MADNLVVIPSARLVASEMFTEVGHIPPVLIPLNGRPLLETIINKYEQAGFECDYAIIVNERKELIADYVERTKYRAKINLVDAPADLDLGNREYKTANRLQSHFSG